MTAGDNSDDDKVDNENIAGSSVSESTPSPQKSAFQGKRSPPWTVEKPEPGHRPHRRSSLMSLNDDRGSVITLARSASHQISRVWGPPSIARFSLDSMVEGRARSDTEVVCGHDIEQPLIAQAHDFNHDTCSEVSAQPPDVSRRIWWCMNISLAVNVFLLLVKIYAYWVSKSKAILASAADSLVDIASQLVIAYAEYKVHTEDPRFPVGRTRLEAVGVIACAVIMTIATIEVIQSSAGDLIAGIHGQLPELHIGLVMYIILGTATGLKIILWLYTVALQSSSDSMMALAEDHRNDVLSNATAIICGAIASLAAKCWWIDPVGAILISIYIISSWMAICVNQVDKIVGKGAPEEFIKTLEDLANSHHDLLIVDVIRAYFFGSRFLVEMEVVLPSDMSVRESHDIALKLQHKLESFDEVERAFVHVDYQLRDEPEHKVERNLMNKSSNLFESHDSVES